MHASSARDVISGTRNTTSLIHSSRFLLPGDKGSEMDLQILRQNGYDGARRKKRKMPVLSNTLGRAVAVFVAVAIAVAEAGAVAVAGAL